MAEASGAGSTSEDLLRDARQFWKQDRPQQALDAAWAAIDLAPDDCATKALLVELLQVYPTQLQADRRAAYLRLLTDRQVEPDLINTAGWQLLLGGYPLAENAADTVLEALITDLERDELALALLREAPVSFAAAERVLSRLRRWLLLSGRWRRHPEIVTALRAQASLNGGAWPFDEFERARLSEAEGTHMVAAYLPVRAGMRSTAKSDTADPVTRAVAAQYEGWPYPAWTRITVGKRRRLPDVIHAMDPEQAKALPVEADMLIAGCGTGRQAAGVASRYPDARITAIDVSEASLDYARRQCASLSIANVRFFKLDLHDVAGLNQRFHAVHCGGVLHHLSNPEHGLQILANILHPGGVMRIMVYNRRRRLMILGARALLLSDLLKEPMSDDLLRRVRQRFLEQPEHPAAAYVVRSRDFATLAGTHDLLLHRHEDPFDVKRIERALDRAGMRLLSFDIPSPAVAARYDSEFPGDSKHRDFESWASFELSHPAISSRHYTFWCGIPTDVH